MFQIQGGKKAFDQWDLNQKVTNESMVAGDRVRFCSNNGETGITYARDDGGTIVADVPNELLRVAKTILVQLGSGAYWKCEHKTTFKVNPAQMPEGYECTNNTYTPEPVSGVTSWDELEGKPEIPEHTWESLPDKPFGEIVEVIDHTHDLPEILFYDAVGCGWGKISDLTPTKEQLVGATATYYESGKYEYESKISTDFISDTADYLVNYEIFVAYGNSVLVEGRTYTVTPGTYVKYDNMTRNGLYVAKIVLNPTIHPIDEKFLPGYDLDVTVKFAYDEGMLVTQLLETRAFNFASMLTKLESGARPNVNVAVLFPFDDECTVFERSNADVGSVSYIPAGAYPEYKEYENDEGEMVTEANPNMIEVFITHSDRRTDIGHDCPYLLEPVLIFTENGLWEFYYRAPF